MIKISKREWFNLLEAKASTITGLDDYTGLPLNPKFKPIAGKHYLVAHGNDYMIAKCTQTVPFYLTTSKNIQ